MTGPIVVLLLLDLAAIGALPRVFFRRGNLNPMWWLTALPFAACAISLLLGAVGVFEPWVASEGMERAFIEACAVLLSGASIAMIAFTIGTHRVPLALWHQVDDAPHSLVTWGAYAWIRHPFYTSFLLALAAAAIAFPHPGTVVAFVHGAIVLSWTAQREERRLAASEFGGEYRSYMGKTGRFFPRFLPRDTVEVS